MMKSDSNVLHVVFDTSKQPLLVSFRERYYKYGIKRRIQELIEEDLKTYMPINKEPLAIRRGL